MRSRHSVMLNFLLSYATILVVLLAIWIISFSYMRDNAEQNVVTANLSVLDQCQKLLDEKLSGIAQMAASIMAQPLIENYMFVEPPLKDADYGLLGRLLKVFPSYTVANPFVAQTLVYFHDSQTFVAPQGASTRGKLAYDFYLNYQGLDFESWKSRLKSTPSSGLWPSQTISVRGKTERYIAYVYTTMLSTIKNHTASIIALIPECSITANFQSLNELGASHYMLLDGDNQLLFSNREAGSLVPEAAGSVAGVRKFALYGEQALLIKVVSNKSGMASVAAVPYDVIEGKLEPLNRTFLAMFASAIVIGVLLSLLLVHFNTRPLKLLARKLRAHAGLHDPAFSYTSFDSSITNMLNMNNNLTQKLESQRNVLDLAFRERLFQRGFDSLNDLAEQSRAVSIQPAEARFAVFVIRIDEYVSGIQPENTELLRVFHIAVTETLKGIPGFGDLIHLIGMNKIAALYGWPGDTSLRARVPDIQQALNRVYIGEVRLHLSIGVSNPFNSLMDARLACEEADRALEYSGIETDAAVCYADIPACTLPYYYPIEKETQFMRLVRSGDEAEAMEVYAALFNRNFRQMTLSEQMLKQVTYDMKSTFIHLICDISGSTGANLSPLHTRLLALRSSDPAEQQMEVFQNAVKELCACVNEHKKEARSELAERIIAYIEAHCTDENMSLAGVADQFHLSQAYLSRLIKLHSNRTFSEYIEGMRIQLAKRYLLSSNLSINEVVSKTGYSSTNTFFKAFKRTYGMSPSTFRNAPPREN